MAGASSLKAGPENRKQRHPPKRVSSHSQWSHSYDRAMTVFAIFRSRFVLQRQPLAV